MLHKRARGVHLVISLFQALSPYMENYYVCDAWPVRRQTYSYLPSRKASPPIRWYQIIYTPLRERRQVLISLSKALTP